MVRAMAGSQETTGGGLRTGIFSRVRLSPSFRKEVATWLQIAWPTALTLASGMAMSLTNVSILGHLGTDYLSAASLANVWMFITSAIIWTMGDALRMLCSQAHGAGKPQMLGIWLQVGWFWCTVLCIMVVRVDGRLRYAAMGHNDHCRHPSLSPFPSSLPPSLPPSLAASLPTAVPRTTSHILARRDSAGTGGTVGCHGAIPCRRRHFYAGGRARTNVCVLQPPLVMATGHSKLCVVVFTRPR